MDVNMLQQPEITFYSKIWKLTFSTKKRPNDQKLRRKKTKIIPKRFFSSKKFDDFLSIKKKSKIFLKKNCNGKKIDDIFGQKIDDFLKKVKIRLRIKTPKKNFRLRRAFFRGHLKKNLSVWGRRSALRASRRKIYYFVVGNSGQFRLGEHTTANGRGSTTFRASNEYKLLKMFCYTNVCCSTNINLYLRECQNIYGNDKYQKL